MRRPMTLDETTAAPSVDLAATAPLAAAFAVGGAPQRQAPTSLVLFVGAGCRPGALDSSGMAREGMRCLWLTGVDQAIEASRLARFDALVLDSATLDRRAGSSLAQLRDVVRCPLIMVSDGGDEIDEILALELGADAFLSRPVAPRRLRAHLSALMRLRRDTRSDDAGEAPAPTRVSNADHWQVDRVTNHAHRVGVSIALTELQAAMLQVLLDADGRIVPREHLISAMPLGQAVSARSVDVYIHRLRKRLLEAGAPELLIEAVRGRGYVLQDQASH
jgi:two-component system, OmpR family, response regulator RstA